MTEKERRVIVHALKRKDGFYVYKSSRFRGMIGLSVRPYEYLVLRRWGLEKPDDGIYTGCEYQQSWEKAMQYVRAGESGKKLYIAGIPDGPVKEIAIRMGVIQDDGEA